MNTQRVVSIASVCVSFVLGIVLLIMALMYRKLRYSNIWFIKRHGILILFIAYATTFGLCVTFPVLIMLNPAKYTYQLHIFVIFGININI